MRLIKLKDNIPENYSLEQFLIDYPDVTIFKKSEGLPSVVVLSKYNVHILVTTPQPDNSKYLVLGEGTPEFKNGEWYQTWNYRQLTDEELEKIKLEKQNKIELDEILNSLERIDIHPH